VHRSITVLFRRDASRDRRRDRLQFAGYRLLWPDGREVDVGLDAFCRYGQRLLGLDRHLAGATERLIEVLCFPIPDPEGPMTRLPGHRVRRFFLHRQGPRGRLHFLDGTPTQVDFVLGRDEATVVEWIGLADAPDHARLCLDLAARPLEPAPAGPDLPPAVSLPMPMELPPSSSLSSSSSSTPPGLLFGPLAEEGPHS
jgi:hypothetical protein